MNLYQSIWCDFWQEYAKHSEKSQWRDSLDVLIIIVTTFNQQCVVVKTEWTSLQLEMKAFSVSFNFVSSVTKFKNINIIFFEIAWLKCILILTFKFDGEGYILFPKIDYVHI